MKFAPPWFWHRGSKSTLGKVTNPKIEPCQCTADAHPTALPIVQ